MYKAVQGAVKLTPTPALEAYFEWARARGIRWDKIEYPVLFPPGYIGSRAIAPIQPGEPIIIAPNPSLLTTKVALNSEMEEIYDQNKDLFSERNPRYEDLVLITFLIWEKYKGEDSEWHDFIISQPECPEVLQDWSIDEIKELQDEDLEYESKSQLATEMKIYSSWKKVIKKYPMYFKHSMMDYKEFNWAYKIIGTRTFGKFVPYATFTPIGEFLNHNNTETFYCYVHPDEVPDSSARYDGFKDFEDHDDDIAEKNPIISVDCQTLVSINKEGNTNFDDSLKNKLNKIKKEAEEIDGVEYMEKMSKEEYQPPGVLLSESDEKQLRIVAGPNDRYEEGSEVYMSYGRYSNRQLLCVYGFSLKNNIYNYARIKTNLTHLSNNPDQIRHIRNFKLNRTCAFKIKAQYLCLDLIRTIRALRWKSTMSEKAFFSPADIDLELEAFGHAKFILQEWLSYYPTTYEQDLQLLQENPPMRLYFALTYRTEVKRILKKQIQLINVTIEILQKLRMQMDIDLALIPIDEYEQAEEVQENRRAIDSYLRSLKSSQLNS